MTLEWDSTISYLYPELLFVPLSWNRRVIAYLLSFPGCQILRRWVGELQYMTIRLNNQLSFSRFAECTFKGMTFCENCDPNSSWLLTSYCWLAIVYSVRAKITSTINEKESTISLFQSSLVSLLTVNELRLRHHYQQHSLFNYSYWAFSVSPLLPAILPPLPSFFFFSFREVLFTRCLEVWWMTACTAQFGWFWLGCLCTDVVHKLLDRRETEEEFKSLPFNRAKRCFCRA